MYRLKVRVRPAEVFVCQAICSMSRVCHDAVTHITRTSHLSDLASRGSEAARPLCNVSGLQAYFPCGRAVRHFAQLTERYPHMNPLGGCFYRP